MRSKAPLALMEQLVMILVFALASALCLRVFVFSDRTSRRIEAEERASAVAQSAAEAIKYEGSNGMDAASALKAAADRIEGSCKKGVLTVYYDKDWDASDEDACAYRLSAEEVESDADGLCVVRVTVTENTDGDGEDGALFEIDVAWQLLPAAEIDAEE